MKTALFGLPLNLILCYRSMLPIIRKRDNRRQTKLALNGITIRTEVERQVDIAQDFDFKIANENFEPLQVSRVISISLPLISITVCDASAAARDPAGAYPCDQGGHAKF